MKSSLTCPYCGQRKQEEPAEHFIGCRICGFKSALVPSDDGMLLIVDRQMPYLKKRCEDISCKNPDLKVVIDRRINQDPLDNPNRRLPVGAEEV